MPEIGDFGGIRPSGLPPYIPINLINSYRYKISLNPILGSVLAMYLWQVGSQIKLNRDLIHEVYL